MVTHAELEVKVTMISLLTTAVSHLLFDNWGSFTLALYQLRRLARFRVVWDVQGSVGCAAVILQRPVIILYACAPTVFLIVSCNLRMNESRNCDTSRTPVWVQQPGLQTAPHVRDRSSELR